MPPLEWIAGFVEGEGTFSGSQRTPDYFQPNFSVYQKDIEVLAKIASVLEGYGIPCNIYRSYKGLHTLSVTSIASCIKVYDLLRPLMHAPVKIAQADKWRGRLAYRGRNVKI